MKTRIKVFLGDSGLDKFIMVKFPTLKVLKEKLWLLIRQPPEICESDFIFRTWSNPERTIKDFTTRRGDEKEEDFDFYINWYYTGHSPVKFISERSLYKILYETQPNFKGTFAKYCDMDPEPDPDEVILYTFTSYETTLDIDWTKVGEGRSNFIKQLVEILRVQNHESLIGDETKNKGDEV